MLGHCWASVVDGGPTMIQHQVNAFLSATTTVDQQWSNIGILYACVR